MSGRDDMARELAEYWRRERMERPDDVLLEFLGTAVGHAVPCEQQHLAKAASDALEKALPQFCDKIMRQTEQRLDGMRQELSRGGHVNLNVRAPKRTSPYAPVLAISPSARRPLPIAKLVVRSN